MYAHQAFSSHEVFGLLLMRCRTWKGKKIMSGQLSKPSFLALLPYRVNNIYSGGNSHKLSNIFDLIVIMFALGPLRMIY